MNRPPLPPSASPLEAYPHIRERLTALWGSYELDVYLNHLITDTRGGQRKGFPADALLDLMFLVELNKLIRAIDLARLTKISLREATEKIEARDHGAGETTAHVSRDAFVREGPDLARRKPMGPRTQVVAKKDGSGGGFGKMILLLVLLGIIVYLAVYR